MLTDMQEAFVHFEKNKLSDSWQEILEELLESEENTERLSELYNRLELSECLLSACLEILTSLARKKANRVEIKETMYNTELSDYAGGYMFSYDFDAGINERLKELAQAVNK